VFCSFPAFFLGASPSIKKVLEKSATKLKLPVVISFEEANLKAYSLLLRIEIALRESLRISLTKQFGPKWRSRLPGISSRRFEKLRKKRKDRSLATSVWAPFYYLTLGELVPILRQQAGKSTAASFGGNCFIEQVENILGPRNAICHARGIPLAGLKAIEALYQQMETASMSLSALLLTFKSPH
jgi:hypothetical protein